MNLTTIRVYLMCCGAAAVLLVLLTRCDSAPSGADSGEQEAVFSWTPDEAFDQRETVYTLRVTHPGGLRSVSVRGLDTDFFQQYDNIGSDSFETEITKRFELNNQSPRLLKFEVKAVTRAGSESGRIINLTLKPFDPPPVNVPPELSVSVSAERFWQEQPVSFRFEVTEDFSELAALQVDFGDGATLELPLSGATADTTITHTYHSGGTFGWTVTATDNEGLSTTVADDVVIAGMYDLYVQTTAVTYLPDPNNAIFEPDNTARMIIESRDGLFFEEFYSNNGVISGRVPGLELEVEYSSDFSMLSRMRVDRGFYPDEAQYPSYMSVDGAQPGYYSWVVRGYPSNHPTAGGSDFNWFLDVNSDINTVAETVKGAIIDFGWVGPQRFVPAQELLARMTWHMTDVGEVRVPKVRRIGGPDMVGYEDPLVVVINKGNTYMDCTGWDASPPRPEDCIDQKSVENGNIPLASLPDQGVNPGGVIPRIPSLSYQNAYAYIDLMKSIFNGSVVNGNPYNIQIVEGFSHELKDYLDDWYVPFGTRLNLFYPIPNVFFISYNEGAGTESHQQGTSSAYIPTRNYSYARSAHMIVPGGTLLRGFTNEATMFGFTRETRPAPDGTPRCNYSIRDDTTGSCWPLPETDFSDFDVVGHIILGSFANYGHLQKTHYDRHISGNGLGNRDGFALTFPITFD